MELVSISATRSRSWVRLRFSSGSFLYFPIDSLVDQSLKKGQKISKKKLVELKTISLHQKLLEYSYKILAQRSYSIKNITQKIDRKLYEYSKKYKLDIDFDIQKIIEILKEKTYLDDDKFAKQWIEGQIRKAKKSNKIILQSLFQKGICPAIIKKYEHLLDKDKEEALLETLLEKKTKNMNLTELSKDYKKLNKLIASFLRTGFDYHTIRKKIDQKLKKQ